MAKNILIVDDEAIITKSLQRLLKKQGYQVTVANSGREAMEEIKNRDFNLIVCDIRMPRMDGIETIREIRKYLEREGKQSIPEVFITGYADEEKYQNAVNLKVAGYIYKPFDREEFLEVIKRNLGSS